MSTLAQNILITRKNNKWRKLCHLLILSLCCLCLFIGRLRLRMSCWFPRAGLTFVSEVVGCGLRLGIERPTRDGDRRQ
jgi:uncharacterized membrane protein